MNWRNRTQRNRFRQPPAAKSIVLGPLNAPRNRMFVAGYQLDEVALSGRLDAIEDVQMFAGTIKTPRFRMPRPKQSR